MNDMLQIIPGEDRNLDALRPFHVSEITHAAVIELRNGAELNIARTSSCWVVGGNRTGGKIALSHEATEVFVSAVLQTREQRRPLPDVHIRTLQP